VADKKFCHRVSPVRNLVSEAIRWSNNARPAPIMARYAGRPLLTGSIAENLTFIAHRPETIAAIDRALWLYGGRVLSEHAAQRPVLASLGLGVSRLPAAPDLADLQ
jgi:hypothetical protein